MRLPTISLTPVRTLGVVSVCVLLMLVPTASPQAMGDDGAAPSSSMVVAQPDEPSAPSGSTIQVVAEPQAEQPQPTPEPQPQPQPEPATPPQSATAGVPTLASPDPNPAAAKEVGPSAAVPHKPTEEAIEPIPEPDPTTPAKVHTAGFNGITPGGSTKAHVAKLWGPPKESQTHEGVLIHRYVIKPFDQIEVTFTGEKVASIIVRLQKAFPAEKLAEQLGLSNVRPVLVSNELGDILGQAYPERGILFAFAQNHQPGSPSMQVTQIVMEPVSADSFVLRAETNLQSNLARNLHDLDEAIKLAPNHARAHWLRSRVLAAMGQADEAVEASRKANLLDENNASFRVSHAQILNQAGLHTEAIAETARAITISDSRPHVKARAQCLMGDLLADGSEPDWPNALKFHMAAIKTADPLTKNRHPAIRLAAKEVLIDAHLGAAGDIAWGRWGGKEKAVTEWTQRASTFAEELIANDGGTNEHRFRVASRTLAAYVGVQGKMDPTDWVRKAVQVGNQMIEATTDDDEKQQLRWELGMALFNAVQIYQCRKQYDFAVECGQQAAMYFEPGEEGTLLPEQEYLLGRLYFRLGAIQAMNKGDHAAAVAWFDKAAPMLAKPFSKTADDELGRQGETLVSMGVSYWEAQQRDKALELTNAGLGMMRQAVEAGAMPQRALCVPYDNLATMQKHLGNEQEAAQMSQLAAAARASSASAPRTQTARQPGETIRR